jgi:hypothetical protein
VDSTSTTSARDPQDDPPDLLDAEAYLFSADGRTLYGIRKVAADRFELISRAEVRMPGGQHVAGRRRA